jgi:hypothetical protein
VTPVSDFERSVVEAMLRPSFPDLTEDEVRFVAVRWRNLPGVFSMDVEVEPEIEWLMSRRPTVEIETLQRLLDRSRERLREYR